MNLDMPTTVFGIVILAIIIAYDVWTLVKRGYDSTISFNLWTLANHYPISAFALGVVFGHLYWPHGGCVP